MRTTGQFFIPRNSWKCACGEEGGAGGKEGGVSLTTELRGKRGLEGLWGLRYKNGHCESLCLTET